MSDEGPEITAMERTIRTADGRPNWVGIVRHYLLWFAGLLVMAIVFNFLFDHVIAFPWNRLFFVSVFPLGMLAGAWFRLPERER